MFVVFTFLLFLCLRASDDCFPDDTPEKWRFENTKLLESDHFQSEMQIFVEKQNMILQDFNGDYIIFHPIHTGIGNRLQGLISTFLLAYLTNRAFLVNWDYLDPLTDLPRFEMVESEILKEPFPWSINFLRQFPTSYLIPNTKEFELRGGKKSYEQSPLVEAMCCSDLSTFFDKQFIIIKGNKYFAQLLTSNPFYAEKIEKLFGKGVRRDMFSPLLRFLVQPKAEIWQEISTFLKPYDGRKIIGIQVRTTEQFSRSDLLSIFEQCADFFVDSSSLLFLSTDSQHVRNHFLEHFGNNVLFYQSEEIYMNTDLGMLRTTVRHGLKDILTLSLCHEMIVTCASSFSQIAAAFQRRPPIIASGMSFLLLYNIYEGGDFGCEFVH
jgi:hypothetical protein